MASLAADDAKLPRKSAKDGRLLDVRAIPIMPTANVWISLQLTNIVLRIGCCNLAFTNTEDKFCTEGRRMATLRSIRTFLRDSDGTTAVEYCVMLAAILLVMIVSIVAAGSGISDWWNNIDSELDTDGF